MTSKPEQLGEHSDISRTFMKRFSAMLAYKRADRVWMVALSETARRTRAQLGYGESNALVATMCVLLCAALLSSPMSAHRTKKKGLQTEGRTHCSGAR